MPQVEWIRSRRTERDVLPAILTFELIFRAPWTSAISTEPMVILAASILVDRIGSVSLANFLLRYFGGLRDRVIVWRALGRAVVVWCTAEYFVREEAMVHPRGWFKEFQLFIQFNFSKERLVLHVNHMVDGERQLA